MADNRGIVYREGDWWVFRASSVGRSLRCLTAAMAGYSPLPAPDYLIRAAEAGTRYEGVVKGRLREQGYEINDPQGLVEVVIRHPAEDIPGLMIRGHLDAYEINHESLAMPHMLEVKSMSARVFAKWQTHRFDAFPEYAAQLTAYMSATSKPAVYAVVCREDDYLEVTVVPSPPIPWVDIVTRVLQADYHQRNGTLPECDSASQYACPFEYLCTKRPLLSDEVESGSDQSLRQLALDYDEIRKLEADLKARKDDIRSDIILALGERPKVQVGRWSFSKTQATRTSPDIRALRELLGDKLDKYMKTSEYTTVSVREVKVGGE